MEHTSETLTIEALAERAGTTVRTVRYYITQGLLTGPDARGRAAHYTVGHLDRLRIIRYLVGQHLPLREIRAFLTHLSPREQSDLLANMLDVPTASVSLPYPMSRYTMLDDLHDTVDTMDTTAFLNMPPVDSGQPLPSQSVVENLLRRAELRRDLAPPTISLEDATWSVSDLAPPGPVLQESVSFLVSPLTPDPDLPHAWRRYEIAPGLELHVRDDVAASQRALIEAMLACGHTSRQENGE